MKSWIFRISIVLNVLVIVLVLGVWFNKGKFIRAYLAGIYTYIDLYSSFLAFDGSIDDELAVDELHLSGKDYRLWQSLLQLYMAEH